MIKYNPDNLFAMPREEIGNFVFDEAVSGVFADMINRSVPGYQTMLGLLGVLVSEYAQPGSRLYDLGCSLGASTLMLQKHVRVSGCKIIAVDNAGAMVARCRNNLMTNTATPVDVICADIQDIAIKDASIIVMNLTLQFISPERREPLLRALYQGLRPGGVLVLSEKIRFASHARQALFARMHHAFKRANGYSDLEISQKRTALENVLFPDTLETHHNRLRACGFSRTETCFTCLNFASLLAIKG